MVLLRDKFERLAFLQARVNTGGQKAEDRYKDMLEIYSLYSYIDSSLIDAKEAV